MRKKPLLKDEVAVMPLVWVPWVSWNPSQARENVFKLGPETWSGPNHILCYTHAKSAALILFP